ncbi:short-chain fatty acid transporter [Corynebacterium aquatimens]|uniref:TIGR00366 family protein n=1 Tax=Corynebacterium aquatimens TaxID=1190508 RepID=UPI002542122E|nr:TIGR00366 family protein [Corynebacterium aquatimens]QYH19607.1 short-chain fatty acid transporter [Corynebacterium aquatimens]
MTTAVNNGKAPQRPPFRDRYIAWFEKWMPESFVICLALTIIVAILAFFATDTPVWSTDPDQVSLVSAWAGSFWNLLAFTMQMTVLLASGSAVASSPPAQKLLTKIGGIPKTRTQAIVLGSAVAGMLGFIHWGLGMMAAIVLGKEILAQSKRRGLNIHPPVMVAVLFMAFLTSSSGISGAAVLYSATPNYLRDLVPEGYKEMTPEAVGLTDSILRWDFILLLIVCLAVTMIFAIVMHPKDASKIGEIDSSVLEDYEAGQRNLTVPVQRRLKRLMRADGSCTLSAVSVWLTVFTFCLGMA